MKSLERRRDRPWLIASFVCVVALGLASRQFPVLFPTYLGKYPGDALWAFMVLVLVTFIRPGWSSWRLALAALVISYLDEFSQIYQASWSNVICGTTIGHLALGSRFSWLDICAYTIGIGLGLLIDLALPRHYP